VDALEKDDRSRARSTAPAEKLRQALEMMAAGIRLKRAALRHRHPEASESEIDDLLRAWLERDD